MVIGRSQGAAPAGTVRGPLGTAIGKTEGIDCHPYEHYTAGGR
jgi:hypothetical protein